jgi:hypothetical protein
MRQAKSYSIVDHQLLHARHLHRLSHQALALYLFFIVVGDREGRSFYSASSIVGILRFSAAEYAAARTALEQASLIELRRPYVFVKNLAGGKNEQRRRPEEGTIPVRRQETELLPNSSGNWHSTQSVLEAILRQSSK